MNYSATKRICDDGIEETFLKNLVREHLDGHLHGDSTHGLGNLYKMDFLQRPMSSEDAPSGSTGKGPLKEDGFATYNDFDNLEGP